MMFSRQSGLHKREKKHEIEKKSLCYFYVRRIANPRPYRNPCNCIAVRAIYS